MENNNPRSRLSCTEAGVLISAGQSEIIHGMRLKNNQMVQSGIRKLRSAGLPLLTIFFISKAMIRDSRRHPNF